MTKWQDRKDQSPVEFITMIIKLMGEIILLTAKLVTRRVQQWEGEDGG